MKMLTVNQNIGISVIVAILFGGGSGLYQMSQPERYAYSASLLVVSDPAPLTPLIIRESSPFMLLRGVFESASYAADVSKRTGMTRRDVRRKLSGRSDAASSTFSIRAESGPTEENRKLVEQGLASLVSLSNSRLVGPQTIRLRELDDLLRQMREDIDTKSSQLTDLFAEQQTGGNTVGLLEEAQKLELELQAINSELSSTRSAIIAQLDRAVDVEPDIAELRILRTRWVDARTALDLSRSRLGPENPTLRLQIEEEKQARNRFQQRVSDYREAALAGRLPALSGLEVRAKRTQRTLSEIVKKLPLSAEDQLKYTKAQAALEAAQASYQVALGEYSRVRISAASDSIRWSILDHANQEATPANRGLANLFVLPTISGFLGTYLLLTIASLAIRRRNNGSAHSNS